MPCRIDMPEPSAVTAPARPLPAPLAWIDEALDGLAAAGPFRPLRPV
jgi:hypothetical protein